jgi:hypothetical protein
VGFRHRARVQIDGRGDAYERVLLGRNCRSSQPSRNPRLLGSRASATVRYGRRSRQERERRASPAGEAWKDPDAMVHHDGVVLGVILRPLFGSVSLVLFFSINYCWR